MSALILKDYFVIFRQMRIFLLLVLVFSCIPGAFYSTFAVGVRLHAALHALAYDERSHWGPDGRHDALLRPDVVLGKYAFGWIGVAHRGRSHLRAANGPGRRLVWGRRGRPPPSSSSPSAWPCASWTSPCP